MIRDIRLSFLLVGGFLLSGLLPVMIVALISFGATRTELKAQAFRQLESVRNLKRAQVERIFDERQAAVAILSQDPYLIQAQGDLCAAFVAAGGTMGGQLVGLDNGMYRAPDSYRQVHDQYIHFLSRYVEELGYYDLMLLDHPQGSVCFTVKKERDFASQNDESSSALHESWSAAARAGRVVLSDTQRYPPSHNAFAQFVGAPLLVDGRTVGGVVLQISVDAIDAVMQDSSGMGRTGETFLVGPDFKMRSDAPLDPIQHSLHASFAGTVSANGVDTEASLLALAGQTGIGLFTNYAGRRTLTAYSPVSVSGMTWAILAEIEEAEIDAQIDAALNHKVILLMMVSGTLVLALALGIAWIFQRSIRSITSRIGLLSQNVIAGRLSERGDPDSVWIDFREVVLQVNGLIEAFLRPIRDLTYDLERIARGEIPPKLTDCYAGDFVTITDSINRLIDVLNGLLSETHGLIDVVRSGTLDSRSSNPTLTGAWADLIAHVNELVASFVVHLDSIPAPIMIVDRAYQLRFINESGARLVGATREALQGAPCASVVCSTLCGTARCPLRLALDKLRATSSESTTLRSGATLHLFHTASPVVGKGGEVLGGLEVIIDQTEARRIEGEKLRLEEQVGRMQRLEAIGTLAGGIAHDFNNILTYMYSYVDLVRAQLPAESEASAHVDRISSAIGRASELVHQILTFSRQTPGERRVLDIEPVVKETVKLIRATLPKSISVVSEIRSGRYEVLGDPSQVYQVVINLLTNAFHAMQEQGGLLTVILEPVGKDELEAQRLMALAPGDYCRLIVRDTGCGMDAQIKERIFEPFFTTKPVGQGTGMGLSCVHGIVTDYGGAVDVESAPGVGSTFSVYLPIARSTEFHGVIGAGEAPDRGSGRIMFVDDEEEICRAGRHMLESLGYEVVTETRGVVAAARLESDPDRFALLITDLSMPGMTGVELTKRVLECCPGLPILLATGYDERMNAQGARALGAAGLLLKPYSRLELGRSAKAALESKSRPV